MDSYLRVLLRIERKKIDVLLRNVQALSFSAAEDLSDIAGAIAALQKRLLIAERLGDLRRHFESLCSITPPSITENIDRTLDTAAPQLHPFVLNNADISSASGILDAVESFLKTLSDDDAQARTIAVNFTQFQHRLNQFPYNYFADLKVALPAFLKSLLTLSMIPVRFLLRCFSPSTTALHF